MISLLLIIFFSLVASLESAAYGIYEIGINKNKAGGIILIFLSAVGLVLPTFVYAMKL